MNIREINYQVYVNDISPKTVQRAGIQNEHNATVLKFHLTSELINKLFNLPAGRKLYYRFDVYDSSGGYHPTAPVELVFTEGALKYELGQGITSAGGNISVYLIISMISPDETELIVFNQPALLELDNVPSGTTAEEKEVISLSAPVAAALEYLEKTKEQYKKTSEIIDKFNLDLKSKVRNFVGVTQTNIYDGLKSPHITLMDGSEHTAVYGDTVLPMQTFKADLNGDGYVDEQDLMLLSEYLSWAKIEEVDYDINRDGKSNTTDLSILKFMIAGERDSCYFWWNGNEWKPYSLICDRVYNPKSLNPQSGVAVNEAIEKVQNKITNGELNILANSIKASTTFVSEVNLDSLAISPLEHKLTVECTATDSSKVKVLAFHKYADLARSTNYFKGYGLGNPGQVYQEASLSTTNYIEVKPNQDYYIRWTGIGRWYGFFDKNGNHIEKNYKPDSSDMTEAVFRTPANAMYIRITCGINDICYLYACTTYKVNEVGVVSEIPSTISQRTLKPYNSPRLRVTYRIDVNEEILDLKNKAVKSAQDISLLTDLVKAIQTMSIDVSRTKDATTTWTVEPETIYVCDSGDNENLISFTIDNDDYKATARIVLMVVGKEGSYDDQSTLAYAVILTKGTLFPDYGNWSFTAIRKNGYKTKFECPVGSTVVKIKNVKT